jgi:magnesium-transporting ATPase (P-type)
MTQPPYQGSGNQPGQFPPSPYNPSGPGQPYGAAPQSQPPYGPSGTTTQFGVVGAALALLGAIALVVSFTAVDWFKKDGSASSHASDVHKFLNSVGSNAVPISKAYFGWLCWALLVVVVGSALLANVAWPAAKAFRIIGPILAVAGIAVTFLAIRLLPASAGLKYSEYLKNARLGFYLAVAGFLIAGVGAAIGARRSRV